MGMRKTVKKILQFELLWKLLVMGLISPLFREVYQTYVASVGVSFNKNMLWTFLNPKGGLLFVLLFFGAAGLVCLLLAVHLAVNCWVPPLIHRPLAIGHRGSSFAVENTLEAVLAVEELLVCNRLVTQAREQDLPVYVWSVYDSEKMQQYLEMGVSGLISDYPNDARRVVDAYRESHPNAEYRAE